MAALGKEWRATPEIFPGIMPLINPYRRPRLLNREDYPNGKRKPMPQLR